MQNLISKFRPTSSPRAPHSFQPRTTASNRKGAERKPSLPEDKSEISSLPRRASLDQSAPERDSPIQGETVKADTARPGGLTSAIEKESGLSSRDGGTTLVMFDEPTQPQQDDDFTASAMRGILGQMLESATLGPKASDEFNAEAMTNITGQMHHESSSSRRRQRQILHDQDRDHHDALRDRIDVKARSQEAGARVNSQLVQSVFEISRA